MGFFVVITEGEENKFTPLKQMTNLNLVPFKKDGLELVINTETGEAFASISAVARMIDKEKSTISRYVNGELQGVAQMTLLSAEINTASGLQGVALLKESQILEVVSRYKPELLIKFAQIGLRMFLHQLAGYEVTSTAVSKPEPRRLPPVRDAVEYLDALERLPNVTDLNLQSLLRDMLEDEMSLIRGKKALTPAKANEFTIVKVRATELGYSLRDISGGSSLGSYVAKRVDSAYSRRVGDFQVKHYLVTDELDDAIHSYFER
jgi:hypothetical protein